MHSIKVSLLLVLSLSLSACFNDNEERSIVLGNVSLGDQLVDLKKAHDAGAISGTEYQQMRDSLINLIADQDFEIDDDDEDEDKQRSKKSDRTDPDEEEEEDEGFSLL